MAARPTNGMGIASFLNDMIDTLTYPVPKILSGPEIRLVTDGFKFPEGPVLDETGDVYLCDVRGRAIYKINPSHGTKEVWLSYEGKPNGATWAQDGQTLLIADSGRRQILKIGRDRVVKTVPLSETFNGPNDLTIDNNGIIYFTDPTWEEGHEKIPQYVFACHPNGELKRYGPYHQPNGIKFRDGQLYLAEGATGWIYRTTPEEMDFQSWGRVQDEHGKTAHALDGLEVDAQGRVYVAVYDWGIVAVFDPNGHQIGQIDFPDSCPTNLEFNAQEDRLFVTEAKHGRLFQVTPTEMPDGEKVFFNPTIHSL